MPKQDMTDHVFEYRKDGQIWLQRHRIITDPETGRPRIWEGYIPDRDEIRMMERDGYMAYVDEKRFKLPSSRSGKIPEPAEPEPIEVEEKLAAPVEKAEPPKRGRKPTAKGPEPAAEVQPAKWGGKSTAKVPEPAAEPKPKKRGREPAVKGPELAKAEEPKKRGRKQAEKPAPASENAKADTTPKTRRKKAV